MKKEVYKELKLIDEDGVFCFNSPFVMFDNISYQAKKFGINNSADPFDGILNLYIIESIKDYLRKNIIKKERKKNLL